MSIAQLLDDVIQEILDSWPSDSLLGRPAAEEELAAIRGWLCDRLDGSTSPPPVPEDRLLSRRLSQGLSRGLLERCSRDSGADPARCLEALAALDELHLRTLPPGAEDFAGRLADPDGYELVVEMAHDLRSPLAAITFLAEALRSGQSGDVTDLQRTQLGLIYSAATSLTSIVSDVVDLAHSGGNPLDSGPETFSISDVFEDVCDLVRPMADSKGLEIRRSIRCADGVEGHPAALSRVLANLMVNGIKFAEHGWVELSARSTGEGRIEFSVRDTGRGIDGENLEKLFEPFRKSSGREGSFFSSSGLGLSIARRLLVAMGSELRVETRPDWGTRFYFLLGFPIRDGGRRGDGEDD